MARKQAVAEVAKTFGSLEENRYLRNSWRIPLRDITLNFAVWQNQTLFIQIKEQIIQLGFQGIQCIIISPLLGFYD